jgi:signal transduction histidine kinase
MVAWECPTNPREASGLDPEAVHGSWWLARSDVDPDRYRRIVWWTLGGMVIFLVINVGVMVSRAPATIRLTESWLRWAAAIGSGTGFVVGVFEARAIDRELAAERSRIRQEELRRERDRLDEFADIISHDLRNPLSVAQGYLELARDADDPEDELDRVESMLDRMARILEDTLTLAREGKTVGDTTAVDVGRLATECRERVEGDAELIVEGATAIRADPDRLEHVFENLFQNSIDHAGPGVTIRIGALDDGFYVEDDGPGIPESDREQVFEKGYTDAAGGSGFGLAIVERVVAAHGWSVRVTDGSDGGARFEITGVESADDTEIAHPEPQSG